jgi:hypothetical protein
MSKHPTSFGSTELAQLVQLVEAAEFHAEADQLWENIEGPRYEGADVRRVTSTVPETAGLLIGSVVRWILKPLSVLQDFDLAYANTGTLADHAESDMASKLGKLCPVRELISQPDIPAESPWHSAEVRLVISFRAPDRSLIDDVSVTVRGENLERISNEALELRLEDGKGHQQSIVLTSYRPVGYMSGLPLHGRIENIGIAARILRSGH